MQKAGCQHPEQQLDQRLSIRRKITEEEPHSPSLLLLLLFVVEGRRGFQQQGRAAILSSYPRAQPAALQLLPLIGHQARCRIGNVELPFPYLIAHHEVLLVPMQHAGERALPLQLLQADAYTLRAKAYQLCGIANAKHRYALAGDKRTLPQILHRVAPPIMLGYHSEAGGATVHRI